MSNLTTQLMPLPQPWEITMDSSGHFYRHAATLICAKEENDPKVFGHLLFRAGCDNAYPEIMANVCCFPVDERGWVDYNHQLDPWEQHFHGLREGQSYSFGSDLMLDNLKLWMEAYMRDCTNPVPSDGCLHPEEFFKKLEENYNVDFYKDFKDMAKIRKDYTLYCDVSSIGSVKTGDYYRLETKVKKGNPTRLFFMANCRDLDEIYDCVKAQYKVFKNYIHNLNVKFVPMVDDDMLKEPDKELAQILSRLNKITHEE